MKTTSTFGAAAAMLAAIVTVTAASAQDSGAPQSGQMMQGQDAMPSQMQGGGDMSGMQGMMQMMQQMGPMMEQCTKTMAAMTEQMKSAPNGQDDNG